MPRYVVAGATGRVGSVVAAELLARGRAVRVIVRSHAAAGDWLARGAEPALGSLHDEAFLSGALENAAGFFTLLQENVDPDDFHGARRRIAGAVAAAVRTSRVPHVVLLSAVAAVLEEGNGPAKDLHDAERRLRDSGTTLSALRASYFQDNVRDVIEPAIHAGVYPNLLPSADAAFPMIATRDVGRFAAAALERPPEASEVVDLLGPVYSVRDLAGRLGRALERELQVVDIPPSQHVATLTGAGVPRQLAEAIAEMLAAFGAGRIVPAGDRTLVGTTPVEAVIAECLRRRLGTA